jgi:ATP-binding cassette, sub-family E, member 1
MNRFLEQLDITFRRDPTNYRPRINKVRLFEGLVRCRLGDSSCSVQVCPL